MNQEKNRNRCLAAFIAVAAAVALVPAAAQAATGGAAATGGKGSRIAFTGFKTAGASWYGPGLYGRRTACGQRLRPTTLGVAHKRLPCGTAVKFRHRGRVLVTRVIDRGPYIDGRAWDLTEAASERLDFESVGVGDVRYAVPKRFARTFRRGNLSR